MTGLSWGCFAGYYDSFWLKNWVNVFSMYWIGFDHGTVVWSSMVQCLGLPNPALIFGTFAPLTAWVAFSFSMIECANGTGTVLVVGCRLRGQLPKTSSYVMPDGKDEAIRN